MVSLLKRMLLAAGCIGLLFLAAASYQVNPPSSGFLVSAVVILAFGLFVLFRNLRAAVNLAFFLLALSLSTFLCNVYLLHIAVVTGIDRVETWVWLLRNGLLLAPVALVHFVYRFIDGRKRMLLAATWLAMLSMLPLIVLNFLGHYVTGYRLVGQALIPYSALGLYRLSAKLTICWTLFSATAVAVQCFREDQRHRRVQYAMFLLGWGVATALALFGYSPAFGGTSFPHFVGFTWPFFPLILGIAVVRDGLFDIRVVIRRTLPYAIGTAVIGAFCAACIAGLEALGASLDVLPRGTGLIGLLILVGLAFQPVMEGLQKSLDRIFFRAEAEIDRFLAEAGPRYLAAGSPAALARLAAVDAVEVLKLEGAAVLLGRDRIDAVMAAGPDERCRLAVGLPMPAVPAGGAPTLADDAGRIDLGADAGQLAGALESSGVRLTVPFGAAEVRGLLACGQKLSHLPFTPRDRMFLSALAAQAGTALSRLEARREADAAQRLTEAFFDAMTNPVALLAPDGRVLSANPAFVKSFAVEPGQALPPEASEALFDERLLAGPAEMETPHGVYLASLKRLEERSGEVLAVLTDVTELRRLQDADRRRAALAEVGATVASINHEISNILAPLDFHLQKARKLATEEESLRTWEKIRDRIKAMESLSRELRAFYKEPELVLRDTDLDGVLQHVMADLQAAAGEAWTAPRLEGTNVRLQADPGKLKQVLVNLLKNSWEAMQDGTAKDWAVTARPAAGGMTQIEIRDSGPGIPAGVMNRLFQPFFTTKKGRGTGLGLAITRRIVTAHKGDISVESRPGQGTTMTLLWPVALTPRP